MDTVIKMNGKETYNTVSMSSSGGERENCIYTSKIRRFVNKITESNFHNIINQILELLEKNSNQMIAEILCIEIIKAMIEGPRASDNFVGINAALIAGISSLMESNIFSAYFISHIAENLEFSYKENDFLRIQNMTSLLCQCYFVGIMDALLIYDYLNELAIRFEELDIVIIYNILKICGMKLRYDDQNKMKEYVLIVHEKASKTKNLSVKAKLMLDLVIDVKNNLQRENQSNSFQSISPNISKWLSKICVSNYQLIHLTWKKLLEKNKKGIWWINGETFVDENKDSIKNNISLLELDKHKDQKAIELLKLASAQRMNTDIRSKIFCVIMGSQNCIETIKSLSQLSLRGEQKREIIYVLIDCCLQERHWNPYYLHIIIKLCTYKNHSITLRNVLKDYFKKINELTINQLDNLAKLTSEIIYKDIIKLSIIKELELSSQICEKMKFFWRLLFINLILNRNINNFDDLLKKLLWFRNNPSIVDFKNSLLVFLRYKLKNWIKKTNGKKIPWLTKKDKISLLILRLNKIEKILST